MSEATLYAIDSPQVTNSVTAAEFVEQWVGSNEVPTAGILPFSPRLDTCGPLARSVADTAHVLDAIAGHDPLDPPAGGPLDDLIATGAHGGIAGAPGVRHGDGTLTVGGGLSELAFGTFSEGGLTAFSADRRPV